ncbi:DNA-binding NarL/FixJ family response regulator [Catenulispora sp. EB89]|uniref:response regulator n=1 Tax=Catenulispora sp. EB89 TaxID=3156257 RepID=UPI003516242E
MSHRIVVADDQAVIREGLMMLLDMLPDIDVVGGAENGAQAIARVEELRPDAVLMDLSMPVVDGVEATRHIVANHPEIAVIVLTTMAEDQLIVDALQAGARAYLTKDANKTAIARAIDAAVNGQATLDPVARERLLAAASRRTSIASPALPQPQPQPQSQSPEPDSSAAPSREPLTPRETDVLRLLAQGLPNAAIGRRLLVGEATVKTHVTHLFAKLKVTTRAEATAWAHRNGYRADVTRRPAD